MDFILPLISGFMIPQPPCPPHMSPVWDSRDIKEIAPPKPSQILISFKILMFMFFMSETETPDNVFHRVALILPL